MKTDIIVFFNFQCLDHLRKRKIQKAANPFAESFNLLIPFRHQCLIGSCHPSVQGIFLFPCLGIVHNCCVGDRQREERCLCSCQWHSTFPAVKETVTAVAAQERATQLPGGEGEGRRHCFVTYLDVRGKIPFRAQQGLTVIYLITAPLSWFNWCCWSWLLHVRKVKRSERSCQNRPKNQFKLDNTPTKNYGPGHNDKMYSFNAETELAQNNVSQKSLIPFSTFLNQNWFILQIIFSKMQQNNLQKHM